MAFLTTEPADYNIDIVNTSIEDMDFSDVFTQAVEAKQVLQIQADAAKPVEQPDVEILP